MSKKDEKRALLEAYDRERIERTDAIMARYLSGEISRNVARKEMREMRKILLRKLIKGE